MNLSNKVLSIYFYKSNIIFYEHKKNLNLKKIERGRKIEV